ncbi:hypothetical protein SNL152K_6310 [Streptomyces sp. NL15-2K]|nr:hypothetical protein SNL152K_6310 [Streptomyces sp. NL15-2K]
MVTVRPVSACAVVMGGSLLIEREPGSGALDQLGYAPSARDTV